MSTSSNYNNIFNLPNLDLSNFLILVYFLHVHSLPFDGSNLTFSLLMWEGTS